MSVYNYLECIHVEQRFKHLVHVLRIWSLDCTLPYSLHFLNQHTHAPTKHTSYRDCMCVH